MAPDDPDDREPDKAPVCSECGFKILDELPHFGVYGWCHSVCAAHAISRESMKWGNE